ncbi:ABC transporter permease [Bacillus pseudomycoides]|uniref:ABC transporter permease n=1 Tax=Bacillus pseudomycoides TaxID=64104 RepID=UPI000BEE2A18|nr:ABC transporter permease subunit [Bacillus pseudomycoides]PEE40422.1 ABC transporter permease [Bacillus pseudomycoides]PEI90342.1 ABC transporter permease [Bacillus pseudomycoides]PGA87123.1 ABC transporter permease [Bacillus pseudomycoides]PHF45006.1 ABC transporter permease [Bacillus pseudomycoides]
MKQLMISEFERFFSRKKTVVICGVFFVLLLIDCLSIQHWGVAIYNPEGASAPISQLNFQVALGKELYIILSLLIFPILFIDSFNGERSSGSYRLVCIRPIKRGNLLVAKWLTQIVVVFLLLFLMFVVSYIYGKLFVSSAEYTTFLHQDIKYNAAEALLYTLKFYGILVFITATSLMLASFISLWMPNVVLSFFMTIGIMFGTLYIHDSFSYFIAAGQEVIRILSDGDSIFYLVNGTILVVCMLLSFITWRTKDLYE